jgi:hypothetical protein
MISLSPNDVERLFQTLGIPNRFDADEKRQLTTTGIVAGAADAFAFPTPEDRAGLNILKLREILGTDPSQQPAFFDHPWYLGEEFARQNCSPGWHVLQADVLPDSISRPIDYASSLGSRKLELPAAVEITLMLFLHYARTGVQLLQKKHTWCRDRASLDRFVTVGAFGRNGLFVSGHPGKFTSRGLGVCAKITHSCDLAASG